MMTTHDSAPSARLLERALWCGLVLGSAAVLFIGAMLEPDARGYGTHAQLGLPPCGFLSWTGCPCPGCGLTTAFAHAVRGEWLSAAAANPLGLALFVVVCASIPFGVVAVLRNWTFDSVFDRIAIGRWALAVAGCALAVWVARIATVL